MRTFQFNKKYLNEIHLPIKNLEINLGDQIQKDRPSRSDCMIYITDFINQAINDKDRIFFSKLKPLKATLLFVHGNKHRKWKWHFVDNQRVRSVLKWIREKDGKFDLIILVVCNPGKWKKIETEKSFLVMPSNTFSFQRLANRWVKIILVKPKNSKRLTK